MRVTTTPLALRFARYLHPAGDSCWSWQGTKNDSGYGVIGRGGRGRGNAKAHRVSYEIFHGVKLTPDQLVMHRCDNPLCINPWHLALGTQIDNIADMRMKGRGVNPPRYRGMRNLAAKLNDQKVIEIFVLRSQGVSVNALANRFEVARSTIKNVLVRNNWRHVDVAHHLS